jgi:phosphoenolpyruvate synthase/pyruvate phosphate dikinase
VKAANLATLRTFGFPGGTVPNGFAVPFHFYDEFMKYNGFYEYVTELLKNTEFQQDHNIQVAQLKKLRSLIKKGKMPDKMMNVLETLHKSFPDGTSIRCRSSTNNEDLPGFSGAGLYDSYTHHPDEGHLAKSIKQVYASLWNFRAFEEREFYRVDHFATAMGVLVHPNFKGELANGVAVTDDILYQSEGNYYLNTQVGEDLVTNPDGASIPEEVLLDWWESSKDQVMRTSNRATNGKQLLSADDVEQLRKHLGTIHAKFSRLYGVSLDDERFAMEIEFKITKDGKLVIKQARPWVYAQTR